jgi:hypothetical protein
MKASVIDAFSIAFELNSGKIKHVDFLPIFQKYVKGKNLKYIAPVHFSKFKIKDDRISWGKNEDVAFHIPSLVEQQKSSDQILYII